MRVTPDMTTEAGGDLSKLADIIGEDEVGVLVKVDEWTENTVRVEVDSTSFPSKAVRLTPDDADALADLLKMRAREARGVL